MPGPTGPGTVWYPPYYSTGQLLIRDVADTTGTGVTGFAGTGPAALEQTYGIPSYADYPTVPSPDGYVYFNYYGRNPTTVLNLNGGEVWTAINSGQHWGGIVDQAPEINHSVGFLCRDYRAWDAYWPHRSPFVTIPVNVVGGAAPVIHHPGPPITGDPGPYPAPWVECLPMTELVACVPDAVDDPDDWEWINGGGATIATPPIMSPLGGGVWGLPPKPLHSVGWTEVGRFPVVPGPEGENPAGMPPPGPAWCYGSLGEGGLGTWNITVNLDEHLRDGRLTIVFATDDWFAGDLAAYNLRINPDLSGNDSYWSMTWGVYPVWWGPDRIATPPLRMRQRWIHGSSHAGQTRAHPVITQARGDIG